MIFAVVTLWLMQSAMFGQSPCGNGRCHPSETATCRADCENLITNGGFDENLRGWKVPAAANAWVISEAGQTTLRLFNDGTRDLSVSQRVRLNAAVGDTFAIRYRAKALTLDADGVVTLDAILEYADGKLEYVIQPFKLTPTDRGSWVERQYVFTATRPIRSVNVLLFANGRDTAAQFDDVGVFRIDDLNQFEFKTDAATMMVDEFGQVQSLRSATDDHLAAAAPLAHVYDRKGQRQAANGLTSLGNDRYRMSFKDCQTTVEMIIRSHPRYISFELVSVDDPQRDLTRVDLFRIRPKHIPQRPEETAWAVEAPSDAVFFNALPLALEVQSGAVGPELFAAVSDKTGLTGGGALTISTKRDYGAAIEDVARDFSLPIGTATDGQWIWNSPAIRDSYIFAPLDPANEDRMLNLAKLGKFPVAMFHAVHLGRYDVPKDYPSLEALGAATDRFRAEGIDIALHLFFNQVEQRGGLVDFKAPQRPLADVLYGEPVGRLKATIGKSERRIELDTPLESNAMFRHFVKGDSKYLMELGWNWGLYLIDNEIVRCPNASGDVLVDAFRGAEGTTAADHAAGAEVRFLPRAVGFFINPDNDAVRAESAAGLRRTMARLGCRYLYIDNLPFVNRFDQDYAESLTYMHQVGTPHYLFDEPVPHVQFGGPAPAFAQYYAARAATDDGAAFRNKAYTREHKVRRWLVPDNPYDRTTWELGWWKVAGADFEHGYDHAATTVDDIHYVMGKALAYRVGVGLQFGHGWNRHQQLEQRFALIGDYHELIALDRQLPIFPASVRSYLKEPENEAVLSRVAGWNFIRTDYTEREITLDRDGRATLEIENPFAAQPLQLELRPDFDYVGANDRNNITVADSTTLGRAEITTNHAKVRCVVDDDGTVRVENQSDTVGVCLLQLPGSFKVADHRGIGLSLTGNSGGELLIARYTVNGFAARDHKMTVDFAGKRDLILDSPCTDEYDMVDGRDITWRAGAKPRHWALPGQRDATLELIVNNVAPGRTSIIKVHRAQLLQEKTGNRLVNPSVQLGDAVVKFDAELRTNDVDAHMLRFDGRTGAYELLTSNHQKLDERTATPLFVPRGRSTIRIKCDVSDPAYSRRLFVKIRLQDDPDGDGIPTDGNFSTAAKPCTGQNDFCDDNCPSVFNPDQRDSDGDGIGDACDL